MKEVRLIRNIFVRLIVPFAICVSVFAYVVGRSIRPTWVTIRSSPPRATVFDQAGYVGITPVRLLLEPGEKRLLRLVRRDCKDREILVRADTYGAKALSEKWDFLLYGCEATAPVVRMQTTLTSSLSVTADPSGAEVYLDGRRLGIAPLWQSGLAPGAHRLRLVKKGFFPKERAVEFEPGEETSVEVTLESKWAALYRQRIAEDPGGMTNYAELAHEYVLRGKFKEAEGSLWDGLAALAKRGAREHHRFFDELWRIYTRYFIYPREGSDESLRPTCRKIMQEALEKKLYNAKRLARYLRLMDRYDKLHPP